MNEKKDCRIKFVKILEILERETDEQHFIKTNDIIAELEKVGVTISRKQLYKDMDTLIDEKYPIIKRGKKDETVLKEDAPKKSNQNEYALKERKFTNVELEIFANALVTNNSLSYDSTSELIDKIASLAPNVGRANIDAIKIGKLKHSNVEEDKMNSFKRINQAIEQNKQLEFNYFKLTYENLQVLRNDGKNYKVNPITTIFSNDHSYLIVYRQDLDDISAFRIDRMKDVKVSDDYIVNSNMIKSFDLTEYRMKVFKMWSEKSKLHNVYFEFKDYLIEAMKDKFGEHCGIKCCKDKNGNAIYTLHQEVYAGEQFYGYVLGLGNGIKIREPQAVVEEFTNYIDDIRKKYD